MDLNPKPIQPVLRENNNHNWRERSLNRKRWTPRSTSSFNENRDFNAIPLESIRERNGKMAMTKRKSYRNRYSYNSSHK